MRCLPPLESVPFFLPMADSTASLLAEVLLIEPNRSLHDRVVDRLTIDPPMVLWAVCRAQQEATLLHSVAKAAAWLIEHALHVLRWEEKCEVVSDRVDRKTSAAPLIEASLQTALLARQLAVLHKSSFAEEAYLQGLLHNASSWFQAFTSDLSKSPPTAVPWQPVLCDVADVVAEAVEILGNRSELPQSLADSLEPYHSYATEGLARWSEESPGIGSELPILSERLNRLHALESRFQETLEEEKLEAMAEFAAGAGHEINNPLAVIAGRAQLFLQDETDPERRRMLAVMNTQAKRVYEMIADMRLFARPPRPQLEQCEMVELLDRVVAELTPQAMEVAISISRTGQSDPLKIEVDPTQWIVAIRAMCKNSIEAIGHQGHIGIDLQSTESEAVLSISDDGPGIAPEVRRHIFDPFYSARQAGRGLGLGLSKCWRIVKQHGGRIDVESTPGEGTTFRIYLSRSCRLAEGETTSSRNEP